MPVGTDCKIMVSHLCVFSSFSSNLYYFRNVCMYFFVCIYFSSISSNLYYLRKALGTNLTSMYLQIIVVWESLCPLFPGIWFWSCMYSQMSLSISIILENMCILIREAFNKKRWKLGSGLNRGGGIGQRSTWVQTS